MSFLRALFNSKKTESMVRFSNVVDIDSKDLTFLDSIGRGAFGTVYFGSWQGQDVAIKVMKYVHQSYDQCENERKILQELTDLNAPNIIQLYGYAKLSAEYHLVTEYMALGSLGDYIDKGEDQIKNWNLNCRLEILKNVANAVVYLHSNGTYHCDIKADNILIDEKNQAKLSDFGFARKAKDTTDFNKVGAYPWMAPEIMQKKPYTDKADTFSFGMMIFEIVAWRVPYNNGNFLNDKQIIEWVTGGNRETFPNNYPSAFKKLTLWAWDQDPKKRPDAKKLSQSLNQLRLN